MRSSGLRRSRFHESNPPSQPNGAKPRKSLRLTDFTKQNHQRLLQPRECDKQQDEDVVLIEAPATVKKDENKKNDPSINQCISMLDPHLTAFREKCDASAQKKSNKDDADDEVPSQLLRLARFFAWRWLPIKKALLRPPPPFSDEDQEVELSLVYRLRLAKACWKKGLLAAAEYESLSASFENRKRGVLHDNKGNKRLKSEHDLMERVRLALMRLPTEVVTNERATLAWRHVHEVLVEYCKSVRENAKDNKVDIDQVADWALTSWTALVLSQGVDASSVTSLNQNYSDSAIPAIEGQFSAILSNREASSDCSMLSQAVATRIDDLLSPDTLKSLNGIHLYSLGRLFARFHSSDAAEGHIAKSISQCASKGGMTGLEQLSRLVGTYVCTLGTLSDDSLDKSKCGSDRITGLERRLMAKMNKTLTDDTTDTNAILSFLKVVLNGAGHLLSSTNKK